MAWIKKHIRINPDKKALQIAHTPIGVWNARVTDERSRKIFFVDVARSLGIEARVDAITKKTQYRKGSEWVDVDYLFVDMPPGTGDVPLTVFQSLPVDGIIIVTSPQDLVSMIVSKAVKMANMMHIPVLGFVENYAYL